MLNTNKHQSVVQSKVSCMLGWPQIQHIKMTLNFDLPTSTSQVLGLRKMDHHTGFCVVLEMKHKALYIGITWKC